MSGELPDHPPIFGKGFGGPGNSWVQTLALALTIVALVLNVWNLRAIFKFFAESQMRDEPGWQLGVLSSPASLLLALAFPAWILATRRPLTLRATLCWVLISSLAVVGWPISCFAANAGTSTLPPDAHFP